MLFSTMRRLCALSVVAIALVPQTALAAPQPVTLTVYHVDDMLMTRIAIRPAELFHYPGVRKMTTHVPAKIAKALTALHAALPSPSGASKHGFDARWAMVFDYANGTRRTIFVDSFMTQTQIDGTPEAFENAGPLKKYLWANFGPP